MRKQDYPWTSIKVAFESEREFDDLATEKFPDGWKLTEVYSSPICRVVIFEVDRLPSFSDGVDVRAICREQDSNYMLDDDYLIEEEEVDDSFLDQDEED